jgi:uncharacterized protein
MARGRRGKYSIRALRRAAASADRSIACEAAYSLAEQQDYGRHRSPRTALRWYLFAARLGHADAANNVGAAFEKGDGVKKSIERAIHWYRTAAKGGSASALYNLASKYDVGAGVPKNVRWAISLYEQALARGEVAAQTNLALLLSRSRSPSRRARAFGLLRQGARSNDPNAQYNLALAYEEGRVIRRNLREALRWYRAAAQAGHDGAELNLGWLYENGVGVRASPKRALHWYRRAARHDNRSAMFNLGLAYLANSGVPPSKWKARAYFSRAAALGHQKAAARLRGLNEGATVEELEKQLRSS